MNLPNKFKYTLYIIIFISLSIITLNSLVQIYEDRNKIISKLSKFKLFSKEKHVQDKFIPVNPIVNSNKRQLPPLKYDDLITYGDEDITGAWTSHFDWNVIGLHLLLLGDGTIMSYGTYAVEKKENKEDIKENVKITLTDKFELTRDSGDHQWRHHNVQSGVDYDIWDPKKGFGKDSHTLYKRPILHDSFCSMARVLDLEKTIIVGGNIEPKDNTVDTQKATTFFDSKNKKFTKSSELNYPRWYGSLVRLDTDEFVILGGHNKKGDEKSIIPEILKKKGENEYFWYPLNGAKSEKFFGEELGDEWSYPKSYLASDGNIFGISYDKLWVLDPKDNGKIEQVGSIPLEKNGFTKVLIQENPNDPKQKSNLILGTIGAGVGSSATSVMIDKDKILNIGGWQWNDKENILNKDTIQKDPEMNMGEHNEGMAGPTNIETYSLVPDDNYINYLPSNHVNLIDISDTKKPKLKRLANMNFPRANGNSILLPNGDVFVHGGQSFKRDTYQINDKDFSVLTPEIYNVNINKWTPQKKGFFKRNYHSSLLLMPNGTILVTGGDVWNAEIFYPPYLFARNNKNKVVFAKRPVIKKLANNIEQRGDLSLEVDNADEIAKISIISAGSTTHAQNSELKYLSLDFKKENNNKISFNIPKDKKILQRGVYLIFAINSVGTPSEGKIVYLD